MTNSASNKDNLINSEKSAASDKDGLLEPAILQGQEVTYPMTLPIKVAGLNQPSLIAAITAICQEFDQVVTEAMMKSRASSSGKYLSLTFDFEATTREQLNDFYRRLESSELIKWTL